MEDTDFDYVSVRLLMQEVFYKLKKAGHEEEANAVASLTHVIGHRLVYVQLPDTGSALRDLMDYLDDCNLLNDYITDGEFKSA